ncbi:hypothetical protein ACH5RR_003244 [Cinchona calisaya]|uniref:Uncharacterized protein n=1 Tax=Cinchona calisaya TaxID=153742 RepID=A0ABD3AUM4_9GENT
MECRGSQQRVVSNDETEEDVQVEIPTTEEEVHGETECSATQKSESEVHLEITYIAKNPRTKEDENGETAAIENVDTNADYFDANNTTKIAEITENADLSSHCDHCSRVGHSQEEYFLAHQELVKPTPTQAQPQRPKTLSKKNPHAQPMIW